MSGLLDQQLYRSAVDVRGALATMSAEDVEEAGRITIRGCTTDVSPRRRVWSP